MPSRIVLRPIGIAVAVVCCVLALGSCEDDGSGPPREATSVVLLEGDGQQAQVGATLPIELVARATDGRGRPVAGQAVTWSVASGGGSLANASAETDADGLARATWTLGTVAGQQTVSVRAGSASAATFTATALAGPAQSLAIVPAALELDAIGATQPLAVSAADAYGNEITGRPVTWASLDEAVVVVSAAGVVQAVGNGATKVRATLDGATAEADVVVAQVAALVQVEPVAPVLVALGETVQLTATALDGNGNPMDVPSFSWTSSDDAVATVDAAGLVTARGDGLATITASLGELSGVAIVTVAREAAAVIVAPETATLRPGETVQLSAEVRDAAGNRIESAAVDWSTSDADVVTVDASGLVTAVADGTATITATSGEASGHATITVVSTKPPRANDDAAAGSSAPGDAFHTAFNTALNGPSDNTPSLLANDDLGDPAATIVSFGGGSLPGNAGTHAAGSSVAGAGGSITVNADGTFTFTPALGFTGLFTFAYRLSNSAGSDDAQVTIAVGSRLIAAAPDNYQAATGHVLIGNVPINTATATPYSVLANDTGEGIIAVLEGAPVNGQVTLNDDGTFTLTPDPGFRNGNVTFQYRVENGFGQSAPVTVTVPVGGRAIWFVDNSKASNGDGRQNSPFTCTLGCLDVSAPGDVIFLHSGSGPYDDTLVLQDDQHVIGQGTTVPLATAAGLTVPPHSTLPATGSARPKFEGDIGVAQNNTLRGFDITSAIGIAIAGANFGTLTISEMDLSAPTHAMFLSGGTLAATFGTLTVTHSWQGLGGMLLIDVDGSLSATTTTITGTDGPAVSLSNTALTLSLGTVTLAPMDGFEGIFADNSSGMISTAGGTITTTNAPALYISGPLSRTPLDLTLTAINVDGGSNGVVLDLTSGPGLTVTGSGAPGSGGTIQNLTDAGILLARTENVSFSNMVIQNTARNGIFGEAVENFTLTSSTISNTGSQPDDANIRFYRGDWPAPLFSGTVTITGNTLSSPFARNIDIDNQTGTITELVISNNVLANTDGEGIRIRARGDFNPPGQILRATIDNNQITTSNATGLVVDCYNDSAAGTPEVRCGLPGSGTDVFRITNNMISGAGPGASLEVGLSAIAFGATRANFHIAGNEILHTTGDALYHQATGAAEVTTTINGNTIVANNAAGAAGINVTTDYPFHPAGNSPVVSVTISNNDVSQTDGSGIVAAALRGSGTLNLRIQNNTVAAPLSGSRPGIRIDSGNADSINETLCLNISGNTSTGSGAALGIGLHKEGTLPGVNAFRIHGMAATATPDVEAYVNGLNPNANGTFLMSATSGFGNCNLP